jgi:hypothetical protein
MLISELFEDPDIMAVVRLGDVTVEVHRHLADQQRKRRVSDRRVEDVLRQIHMVPRRQMMALPHGQRFWVYDPKNDTALGYTMISPERRVLRLKCQTGPGTAIGPYLTCLVRVHQFQRATI